MDRNDWVFVGLRLAGLFLLGWSTLELPGMLEYYSITHREGTFVRVSRSGMADVILGSVLGVVLFLGAPGIERWLERKDARL